MSGKRIWGCEVSSSKLNLQQPNNWSRAAARRVLRCAATLQPVNI
jgi:hypothetical protein